MSKETFIKIFCGIVLALYVLLAALIVGLTLSPSAHADEEGVWLTTGEWSRHDHNTNCPYAGTPCTDRYRQNNTGVGIQIDISGDASVVAGWYNNSVHRESVYTGMTYTPLHFGGFKTGIVGAVATGYTYIPVPIGGFYGSYEYERFGVNLMWLPNVVMAVQLKVRIK